MTPVRQRMTEDMQVRNPRRTRKPPTYNRSRSLPATSANPQRYWVPRRLGLPSVPTNEKKLASEFDSHRCICSPLFSTRSPCIGTRRLEDIIPAPKKPRVAVVLSPEKVLHSLDCVAGPKHRTILTTRYAADLRISEAIRLKSVDIDSKRMVIRVEQGKGQKDRYVMLSPKLLETLRNGGERLSPSPGCFRVGILAATSKGKP